MIKQDRSKRNISRKKNPEQKDKFSQSEVVAYLDMSVNTIKKLVIEGKLSLYKIGEKRYYDVSEVKGLFTRETKKSELTGV